MTHDSLDTLSTSSCASISSLDNLISQAMSAELYLSHFASRDDRDDYDQSILAFASAWCQLKLARASEEFIPSVSRRVGM